jgi:hypothetical protein
MQKSSAWRLAAILGIWGMAGCMAHDRGESKLSMDSEEFPAPMSVVYNATIKSLQAMGLTIKEQDQIHHCLHASGVGFRQGKKDVRVCMEFLQPARTQVRIEYLGSSIGIAGGSTGKWSHQYFQKLWQALHIDAVQ